MRSWIWVFGTLAFASHAESLCGAAFAVAESDGVQRLDAPAGAGLLNVSDEPHAYLEDFRAELLGELERRGLPSAPLELLRRQRALYAADRTETQVFDDVIAGRYGDIGRPGCLADALLQRHLELWPHLGALQLTEFGAFVLTRGPELRIYFVSNGDGPTVRTSADLEALVATDLRRGYALRAHLHNHPFFLDNSTGDIAGTTVPSGGDRPYYLRLRSLGIELEAAWITNGLDLIRVPAEKFAQFPESND
jgi:hypothetical protein